MADRELICTVLEVVRECRETDMNDEGVFFMRIPWTWGELLHTAIQIVRECRETDMNDEGVFFMRIPWTWGELLHTAIQILPLHNARMVG